MGRVLIVDDEAGIREFLADALALDEHVVSVARDGVEAAALLDASGHDLLITDLKMPRMGGMDLLRKIRAEQPEVEVIVLTAHGTVDTAVEAMRLGAFDYLAKPLSGPDELRLLVARALERKRLRDREAVAELAEHEGGQPLTYGDPVMRPVVAAIQKVARTEATVLLLGESGTGKEVAARAIHAQSPRAKGPFMAVNCAALSETLLESELFGHEKGAFTGATERRRGRLELADGGTFFLDEAGELKPELQAKLLRVLQERKFERVGGNRTLEANVRWIAATNRELRGQIDDGRFREDLYHRLSVFPIRLPPLRERPKDLLPLSRVLLEKIVRELKRPPLRLSPEAEVKLLAARWTGNVRELANVLERAAILADGAVLSAEDLAIEPPGTQKREETGALKSLVEAERDAIVRTLEAVGKSRRRAAEVLGIAERTLYDKLKRHGLE